MLTTGPESFYYQDAVDDGSQNVFNQEERLEDQMERLWVPPTITGLPFDHQRERLWVPAMRPQPVSGHQLSERLLSGHPQLPLHYTISGFRPPPPRHYVPSSSGYYAPHYAPSPPQAGTMVYGASLGAWWPDGWLESTLPASFEQDAATDAPPRMLPMHPTFRPVHSQPSDPRPAALQHQVAHPFSVRVYRPYPLESSTSAQLASAQAAASVSEFEGSQPPEHTASRGVPVSVQELVQRENTDYDNRDSELHRLRAVIDNHEHGHALRERLAAYRDADENDDTTTHVPNEFVCPITYVIMVDPVMAPDGHTYERSAIVAWLHGKCTSPMTRERMEKHCTLLPNRNLSLAIERWRDEQATGAEQPTASKPAEATSQVTPDSNTPAKNKPA